MSIFYCRLASKQTLHMYQFLPKGWQQLCCEPTVFYDITFRQHHYRIGYCGQLAHFDEGAQRLHQAHLTWRNELEYLVALYCIVGEDIVHYVCDDSFLLIDDQHSVFISYRYPLYYKREANAIHICNDKRYLGSEHIYAVASHACLRYFNNNLKTL